MYIYNIPEDLDSPKLTNYMGLTWVKSKNYLIFPLITDIIDGKRVCVIGPEWYRKKENDDGYEEEGI